MPNGAQAWGMPKFFDERRLVEELCRENNIRRIDRPTSAIHGYAGISSSMTREPCTPYPLKNIANLRVDFLKRAAEDRFREDRKMEELSSKEFKMEEVELPTNSLPPLSQQELLVRGDYRGRSWKENDLITLGEKARPLSLINQTLKSNIIKNLGDFRTENPQFDKYWPLTLTSTFRTAGDQARIMAENPLMQKSMSIYKGSWTHIAPLVQNLYYGVIGFGADERLMSWIDKSELDKGIGLTKSQKELLLPYIKGLKSIYQDIKKAEELLLELITKKEHYNLNAPSLHMLGCAIDIAFKTGAMGNELFNFLSSKGHGGYKRGSYMHITG